jgi:hypothetical protein
MTVVPTTIVSMPMTSAMMTTVMMATATVMVTAAAVMMTATTLMMTATTVMMTATTGMATAMLGKGFGWQHQRGDNSQGESSVAKHLVTSHDPDSGKCHRLSQFHSKLR